MEVGQTEGIRGDVPAGAEPEEVGERGDGVARGSCKDAVYGWVGVVDRGCVLGGEFGQVVLDIVSIEDLRWA